MNGAGTLPPRCRLGGPRARSAGMSLIEVLAAVAIVAFALLYLQGISSRNIDHAVYATNARMAKMLAREMLENVLLGEDPGSSGSIEGHPGFSFEIEKEEITVAEQTLTQVTVTVRFEVAPDEAPGNAGETPGEVALATIVEDLP